MIELTNVTKF